MTIIVKKARLWLGTPFKHQGRVKSVGCDCIGLVVGVVGELGLKTPQGKLLAEYDKSGYSRVPDGSILQTQLDTCLTRVDRMQIGDIVMMRFRRDPQHVGIISDYGDGLGLIHCYAEAGKVVEHRLDELWMSRVMAVYRLS